MRRHILQGIYAISDELLTPYDVLPSALESALKAGVRIFQLRDKSHSDTTLAPLARELMGLCRRYGALFVLNDRLELALELGAPALHIGRDDIGSSIGSPRVKEARPEGAEEAERAEMEAGVEGEEAGERGAEGQKHLGLDSLREGVGARDSSGLDSASGESSPLASSTSALDSRGLGALNASEWGGFSSIRARFRGILGVSSYGDLHRARIAESLGADYVAFGAFYPSPSKPHAPLAPLGILSQARRTLGIPICAIGGITPRNIAPLHSADMHAVISSLWGSSLRGGGGYECSSRDNSLYGGLHRRGLRESSLYGEGLPEPQSAQAAHSIASINTAKASIRENVRALQAALAAARKP